MYFFKQNFLSERGLDDALGQCDRTEDVYKKFMRQTLLELEGTLEVTESSLLFVESLAER